MDQQSEIGFPTVEKRLGTHFEPVAKLPPAGPELDAVLVLRTQPNPQSLVPALSNDPQKLANTNLGLSRALSPASEQILSAATEFLAQELCIQHSQKELSVGKLAKRGRPRS
jgi:hypothetical protein